MEIIVFPVHAVLRKLMLLANEKFDSSVHRMCKGQLLSLSDQMRNSFAKFSLFLIICWYSSIWIRWNRYEYIWRIEHKILLAIGFDNCRTHETLRALAKGTLFIVWWTSATTLLDRNRRSSCSRSIDLFKFEYQAPNSFYSTRSLE